MITRTTSVLLATLAAGVLAGGLASSVEAAADNSRLTGTVRIDGSSTVYPITEAVAEEFADEAPRVRVTVGVSGTGGGFKRFCAGEIDISDASRPIKASEAKLAAENGIEFIELPVAYDGLTIVVNKENYWVDKLSVDDLKRIFLEDSAVKLWSDLNSQWPSVKLKIFAPGTDSGTFDYFKEVIAGKTGSIRSDMSVSEDDNVLVRGVSGEAGGLGFFGCAYFFENQDKLRAVPIVSPSGKTVSPTAVTIENGSYAPFSRPLFIYVNPKSLARPEVQAFVDFYLGDNGALATEVGYVKLPTEIADRVKKNVASARTGTQFLDADGEKISGPLSKVYR